jgi:Zn-dependent protease
MIGVDSRTPLDLRFPLGPFPVRVSVMFWVIMALLGLGITMGPPGTNEHVNLLIWVACAFVSILAHELGHALAYRYFGSWSSITLHGFGGHAQADRAPRSAGARLVVALAGPAAGFALWGLLLGVRAALGNVLLPPYVSVALEFLLWINLVWSVLNLFPIPPLDGGSACREIAALMGARNPDLVAHGVGFALASALAIFGAARLAGLVPTGALANIPNDILRWIQPSLFRTLWYALLAIDNYQRFQLARRWRYHYEPPDDDHDDDTPPWRRR